MNSYNLKTHDKISFEETNMQRKQNNLCNSKL